MVRRTDPDDTEGRALYRGLAEATVRRQDAMARHKVRLRRNDTAEDAALAWRLHDDDKRK